MLEVRNWSIKTNPYVNSEQWNITMMAEWFHFWIKIWNWSYYSFCFIKIILLGRGRAISIFKNQKLFGQGQAISFSKNKDNIARPWPSNIISKKNILRGHGRAIRFQKTKLMLLVHGRAILFAKNKIDIASGHPLHGWPL